MFLSTLLATFAVDVFEPIAKWATLAVLGAVVLAGLIVFLAKRKAFPAYAKYASFSFVAYLLALCVTFFALDIAKHTSDSYIAENGLDKAALTKFVLIPLLALAISALCSVTAFALVFKYKPAAKKTVAIACGCVCAVALITALVLLGVYYAKKIDGDGYFNSDTATVKQLALYLGAALSLAVIFALAFLDKQKLSFDARSLAYAGVCVGMSFALSYIKLWDMPNGGSLTLASLLPVMLYSYLFGAKKGVFVGFAYGVLQAVQDPWIIHPAQFLLDYPVAFAAAGLAGLFAPVKPLNKLPQVSFSLGALVAGVLRFACHVLSGVFAFEAYAGGQNVWVYSLLYNTYVFADIAIVIVAGVIVLSSKSFVRAFAAKGNQ